MSQINLNSDLEIKKSICEGAQQSIFRIWSLYDSETGKTVKFIAITALKNLRFNLRSQRPHSSRVRLIRNYEIEI